jgi:hypothetical protein
MRPFGNRVCLPSLQHTPIRARAGCRTRPRPNTCLYRNGCVRFAFRPHEDTVFVPNPTCPRPLTSVCTRRGCARIRGCTKSPCPVPCVRARSHQSAPGPTRLRPLVRVRAQRGRAFTSGRTRATARATSTHPQSFPAGAPCSLVRL